MKHKNVCCGLLVGSFFLNLAAFAQAPSISSPPQDQTVVEGDTATFTVQAMPSGSLTYNWYRSDDGGVVFVLVASTMDPWYSFPVVLEDDGSLYRVEVLKGTFTPAVSLSAKLTVTVDTTPPVVLWAVVGWNPSKILVRYNEPVDPDTAEDRFNYAVQDSSGTSMSLDAALLLADGQTVCLTLTAPLTCAVFIEVSAVTDRASTPNVIVSGAWAACLPPQDALLSLIQQVQALVNPPFPTNGDVAILQAANGILTQQPPNFLNTAINVLDGFINSTGNGPYGNTPLAQSLIGSVQLIIDALNGC